ncbi:MAG: metallophosphoesterase family protein [Gammaproteobacteria bacterium]|nr:metallophosphoesterase family protein [Gammaproteobacteria bacterium]
MRLKSKIILGFFIGLFSVSFAFGAENALNYCPSNKETVVGVFGDTHGNIGGAKRALEQMKERGVTHIIGTGDFIHEGGVKELESMLDMITKITGVTKDNLYLMPGNWEHNELLFDVAENDAEVNAAIDAGDFDSALKILHHKSAKAANKIFEKYGHLISAYYDEYGIVEIDGKIIRVSHLPQHPIPENLLPPKEHIKKIHGQFTVLDTMERNTYPATSVDFEIFAHTHIAGSYKDSESKKYVINPGVIDPIRKSPSEICAFAIYYPKQDRIEHISIESDRTITCIDLQEGVNNQSRLCPNSPTF